MPRFILHMGIHVTSLLEVRTQKVMTKIKNYYKS